MKPAAPVTRIMKNSMLNVQCSMLNVEWRVVLCLRAFNIQHSSFNIPRSGQPPAPSVYPPTLALLPSCIDMPSKKPRRLGAAARLLFQLAHFGRERLDLLDQQVVLGDLAVKEG